MSRNTTKNLLALSRVTRLVAFTLRKDGMRLVEPTPPLRTRRDHNYDGPILMAGTLPTVRELLESL